MSMEKMIVDQAQAERKRSVRIRKPTKKQLMAVGEDMARLERDLFDDIVKSGLSPGFVIGVLEKLKLRVYHNTVEGIKMKNIRAIMKGIGQ